MTLAHLRRFGGASAAFALASAAPRAGVAAGPVCTLVQGFDAAPLSPAWRRSIESLRRELAAAPGSCHGVTLVATLEGPPDAPVVRVLAHAPDGAEASRLVRDPVGLSAVAFGLLAAAPAAPSSGTEPSDATSSPAPPPLPRVARARVPEGDDPAEPVDVPQVRGPVDGVTLSASTGARAAFPTNVVMADFDVRLDVAVHGWIVSVAMRAAPFSAPSRAAYDDDAYDETAFALGVGRELRTGRSALVLTGGPALTYMWMENDVLDVSSQRAQLRLAGVARWAFEMSPRLRLNVTFDGEVSPSGIINSHYVAGLAPYPAFTLGLHVGTEALL
jgi:hypothetical protein